MNRTLQLFQFILLLLSGAAFSQVTTFNYTGSLDTYTVPPGVGSVRIEAYGGQGGNDGGLGAIMIGDFLVTPGEELTILVGGAGETAGLIRSGGGGGSFVVNASDEPMIIAGGGGGRAWSGAGSPTFPGIDANTSTNGNDGYSMENGLGTGSDERLGYGGTDGDGGGGIGPDGAPHAANGGGFYTNGEDGTCGLGGQSFLDGGAGGTGCSGGPGGYGGGGNGGNSGGGGGGGYSGGGGSYHNPTNGGGAGSFNDGTDQDNSVGNTGDGLVIITELCSPLTVTVSETEICFGDEVTLSATSESGDEVTWDMGVEDGVAFVPETVGENIYTASTDNIEDCDAEVSIMVNELPETFGAVTPDNDGAGTGSIDLLVVGGAPGYSYDWNNDGTGDFDDTEDLTGLLAGSYAVVVRDMNDCESVSQSFYVSDLAGIEGDDLINISVYPNPTIADLYIQAEGSYLYSIYTLNGELLLTGKGSEQEQLDLSDLSNGVYVLTLTQGENATHIKITKQ